MTSEHVGVKGVERGVDGGGFDEPDETPAPRVFIT